jgi:hypothetical protein
MHWRKSGFRKHYLDTINIFSLSKIHNEQFSFGGMPPSADILRTIEDICAEDETKLQQSFNDYDKCSAISESPVLIPFSCEVFLVGKN